MRAVFAMHATIRDWQTSIRAGLEFLRRVRKAIGGSCEIRTHEGRKPLAVFKTAAFNHSAKLPGIGGDSSGGAHSERSGPPCPEKRSL